MDGVRITGDAVAECLVQVFVRALAELHATVRSLDGMPQTAVIQSLGRAAVTASEPGALFEAFAAALDEHRGARERQAEEDAVAVFSVAEIQASAIGRRRRGSNEGDCGPSRRRSCDQYRGGA